MLYFNDLPVPQFIRLSEEEEEKEEEPIRTLRLSLAADGRAASAFSPLLRRTLRALVSRCVVLRPSPLLRPFISPSSAGRSTLSRPLFLVLFPFIPPQTGEAAVVYLPPRVETDTKIKINKKGYGRGKRRARSCYSGTAILMQRNLRPLSFARRTCMRKKKKKNRTRQLRKGRGEEEDESKKKKK